MTAHYGSTLYGPPECNDRQQNMGRSQVISDGRVCLEEQQTKSHAATIVFLSIVCDFASLFSLTPQDGMPPLRPLLPPPLFPLQSEYDGGGGQQNEFLRETEFCWMSCHRQGPRQSPRVYMHVKGERIVCTFPCFFSLSPRFRCARASSSSSDTPCATPEIGSLCAV